VKKDTSAPIFVGARAIVILLALCFFFCSNSFPATATFGRGPTQTTDEGMVNNNKYVIWSTTGATGGTLDSINAILRDGTDGADTVWAVIYAAGADSAANPGALVALSTDLVIVSGVGWTWTQYHWHFTGVTLTANTHYWIGIWCRSGSVLSVGTNGTGVAYSRVSKDDTPPLDNPFGTPGANSPTLYCFWGSYTESGGASAGVKLQGVKVQGAKF
jgi:hypothetical protein